MKVYREVPTSALRNRVESVGGMSLDGRSNARPNGAEALVDHCDDLATSIRTTAAVATVTFARTWGTIRRGLFVLKIQKRNQSLYTQSTESVNAYPTATSTRLNAKAPLCT